MTRSNRDNAIAAWLMHRRTITENNLESTKVLITELFSVSAIDLDYVEETVTIEDELITEKTVRVIGWPEFFSIDRRLYAWTGAPKQAFGPITSLWQIGKLLDETQSR